MILARMRLVSFTGAVLFKKEAINMLPNMLKDLNLENDKEAEIVAVGREKGVKVLVRVNNAQITKEKVQGAVKEMKAGESARLDGCRMFEKGIQV